jgi:hypothetical protein
LIDETPVMIFPFRINAPPLDMIVTLCVFAASLFRNAILKGWPTGTLRVAGEKARSFATSARTTGAAVGRGVTLGVGFGLAVGRTVGLAVGAAVGGVIGPEVGVALGAGCGVTDGGGVEAGVGAAVGDVEAGADGVTLDEALGGGVPGDAVDAPTPREPGAVAGGAAQAQRATMTAISESAREAGTAAL